MPNDQVAPGLVEPFGRGEDPLFYFTRVFLLFMQGLFEQFPTGSFKWSFDEKLSEIVITDQAPIPRERIEQKPAIVVMRGPAQFANLTLDQLRKYDFTTGAKERTDLMSCTMTINCIAKMGIEAQRIGWIVGRHVRGLKEILLRKGLHKVGEEVSIGPESPPGTMIVEPDPEWIMVTVYCPFFFQWTESVTPTNLPVVRSIEAHLSSALLPPAATTTQGRVEARVALSTPTIRGRVINQPSVEEQRVGIITQTVKT